MRLAYIIIAFEILHDVYYLFYFLIKSNKIDTKKHRQTNEVCLNNIHTFIRTHFS